LSEDLIKLNHFKCFKGKDYPGQYLRANLVTAKRTRILIIVTKQGEILECHRLVVGSNGVVEGRFKGARSWGYKFPAGTAGKDLDVDIFVQPLAGAGYPLSYQMNPLSAEDQPGFRFASASTYQRRDRE
jgi:hypothetical protein